MLHTRHRGSVKLHYDDNYARTPFDEKHVLFVLSIEPGQGVSSYVVTTTSGEFRGTHNKLSP